MSFDMSVQPRNEEVELVFGLAGPVGTEFQEVTNALSTALSELGYACDVIRLSDFLSEYELVRDGKPIELNARYEDERIQSYQDAGNVLRETMQNNAALALRTITHIADQRTAPPTRRAYILHSLKRPEEVEQLRALYEGGFYLVAVVAQRWLRITALAERIAKSHQSSDIKPFEKVAAELVQRDEDEQSDYGQKLSSTFPSADLFVSFEDGSKAARNRLVKQIHRFVKLIMGCTDYTPTRDEAGMFHAYGASVRSGSLARQVGCAIMRPEGDLLSVGCNDVPRAGGGIYWDNEHYDHRDIKKNRDSVEVHEQEIVKEIHTAFQERGWSPAEVTEEQVAEALDGTRVTGLLEFSRALHAEMDALLAAGRNAVSVKHAELFTTTFPCHECAKLILGAGIDRVVYIEPYPKSRVAQMYRHEIATNHHQFVCAECGESEQFEDLAEAAVDRAGVAPSDCPSCHATNILRFNPDGTCSVCGERHLMNFVPFVGVGPGRFLEMFSLIVQGTKQKRKNHRGERESWTPAQRRPLFPASYLEMEKYLRNKYSTEFAKIKKADR
jgi:cytidine deaminase